MDLRLSTQIAITQALDCVGGITESIFPRAEALLLDNSDYVTALGNIGSKNIMNEYRSIMDFLFCEVHRGYRKPCRRYYRGTGSRLLDTISPEQVFEFDRRLLIALEVTMDCHIHKCQAAWGWFLNEVNDRARAA